MKLLLLVASALLGSANALVVGIAAAGSSRVAAAPSMACNGGKGGRGGMGPPMDKMRRGKLKALIQAVRGGAVTLRRKLLLTCHLIRHLRTHRPARPPLTARRPTRRRTSRRFCSRRRPSRWS